MNSSFWLWWNELGGSTVLSFCRRVERPRVHRRAPLVSRSEEGQGGYPHPKEWMDTSMIGLASCPRKRKDPDMDPEAKQQNLFHSFVALAK